MVSSSNFVTDVSFIFAPTQQKLQQQLTPRLALKDEKLKVNHYYTKTIIRKGVSSIPAGEPIVDEVFSTVPGLNLICV